MKHKLLLIALTSLGISSFAQASTIKHITANDALNVGFSEEQITQVQDLYEENVSSLENKDKPTYTVALVCAGLHAGVVINGGLNGCIGFGREGFYLIGIAFGAFADAALTVDGNVVIGFIDYERGSDATGTYESFKISATEGGGGTYISFEKPDHSAVLRLIGVTIGLGAEVSFGTAKVGVLGDGK